MSSTWFAELSSPLHEAMRDFRARQSSIPERSSICSKSGESISKSRRRPSSEIQARSLTRSATFKQILRSSQSQGLFVRFVFATMTCEADARFTHQHVEAACKFSIEEFQSL